MNRCRSMLALQAQAWADVGYGSLLLDLHGTGDSAGEYGDARWQHWLDDIHLATRWLSEQPGGCSHFLAIRLGAGLAAAALRDQAAGVRGLVLWQPVADGKQHFTQFMRVKMAAQMDRPDLPKETTGSMRAQLSAGQPIEVAGYEIHPELARALDSMQLGALPPPAGTRVLWLEQPPPGATELAPASAQALRSWQAGGLDVLWRPFEGPSFWQQHERVLAPALITESAAWLADEATART